MPVDDIADFAALDPFFRIIEDGLATLVDGEHFFDLLAEDVIFEFVISVPGYPRRVEGRQAVAVELTLDRVDDGGGAERAELLAAFLDVAHERCDVGAGERCELHRVLANASGCSRHAHALCEVRSGQVERAQGGETGGGQRRRRTTPSLANSAQQQGDATNGGGLQVITRLSRPDVSPSVAASCARSAPQMLHRRGRTRFARSRRD
jgi:hypothetical protein